MASFRAREKTHRNEPEMTGIVSPQSVIDEFFLITVTTHLINQKTLVHASPPACKRSSYSELLTRVLLVYLLWPAGFISLG
jgi:hypothetical protein